MNAKYFRFLYRCEGEYSVHCASLADSKEKEEFNVVYLRGTSPAVMGNNEPGLFLCAKTVHLLVLGDFSQAAVRKMTEILREHTVVWAVIPKCTKEEKEELLKGLEGKEEGQGQPESSREGQKVPDGGREMRKLLEDPVAYCRDNGVESVEEADKLMTINACGWNFRFKRTGTGSHVSLAFFHGPDSQKDVYEDCVMTVKPSEKNQKCSHTANPGESSCAMECSLYRDFDLCKRQNAKDRTEYTLGTLMLGNGAGLDKKGQIEETIEELTASKPKSVRFIGASEYGNGIENGKRLTEIPVSEGEKRYVLMADGPEVGDTLSEICRKSPYLIPTVISDNFGLCCTGFLKYKEE